MNWIEVWMNDPAVKTALGADPARTFESCNLQVNQEFLMQGDGAHNSAKLLPELIDDGIRLLVYAGHADMMCNYIVRFLPSSSSFADAGGRVTNAGSRNSQPPLATSLPSLIINFGFLRTNKSEKFVLREEMGLQRAMLLL